MSSTSLLSLIHKLVVTKSGDTLGKVSDVNFDDSNLRIVSILVSPKGLVKQLTQEDLIIDIEQILEIGQDKIIVEDAISRGGGNRVIVEDLSPL